MKRCHELDIIYFNRYSLNGATHVKYICPVHKNKGIQDIDWDHLKICAARCPHCIGRYKTTEDFINEMHSINNDIEIIGDYLGSELPVKCRCKKCGHIWSPIGCSLKYGQGCPGCKHSKGEKSINDFLYKYGIKFLREKTFDDCISKRKLKFDFYLPEYNMCIEYDGEQHFEPVDFANKGQEWAKNKYEQIIKRDNIKNEYCKNNNINLLRIPYLDFDNIETILISNLGVKS